MRAVIGGVDFVISCAGGLSAAEQVIPERLGCRTDDRFIDAPRRPPFRVTVVRSPHGDGFGHMKPGEPARIVADGDVVRVEHSDFKTTVDPVNRVGTMYRRVEAGHPLEITLRVALCSALPIEGGLPLHGAGVAVGDGGLVFVGVSGAGKSTLAQCSPFSVFSDELVIVRGTPPKVEASGFWGEEERSDRPGPCELRGIFELGRGERTSISRLDPGAGVRCLLPVVLVPALPRLWREAVSQVIRMARSVPMYHLAWNPESSPWEAVVDAAGIRVADRSRIPGKSCDRDGVECGRDRFGFPVGGGLR